MTIHNCDLCGSDAYTPIAVAAKHMGGQEPPAVCMNCGFVYIRQRRSPEEIIEAWKQLYADKLYDPTLPGIRARLWYVAEWLNQRYGLNNKVLSDFGGGDGFFAHCVRRHTGRSFSWDPSIDINGLINVKSDFVTILWTLENCGDCIALLKDAASLLKPDGRLVVATGSRICVPPRKPFSHYFSTTPADTHAFRWTRNTLQRAFAKIGFTIVAENDWQDNDVLLVVGEKAEKSASIPDNPSTVLRHFETWAAIWP